jgi:predicted house-cleaning noncanonical NTP pyrophosphatase (MazG superfamily)
MIHVCLSNKLLERLENIYKQQPDEKLAQLHEMLMAA